MSYNARALSIDDWDTFRIVVPEDVLEKGKVIYVARLSIELEHVGGGHAENSIIIKVPEGEGDIDEPFTQAKLIKFLQVNT